MRTLGLLLAVSAVLAGCAAQPSGGATAGASPSSGASGSSGAPTAGTAASTDATGPAASPGTVAPEPTISLPTGLPKTKFPEPPTDDFKQLTTQGRVQVSGQCVNLVTDALTWTLFGPEVARLRDGQQVKVVGVPNPNIRTTCGGSPLTVQTASTV